MEMENNGYCCFNGPASDTIEGKEMRKKGARFLRMLCSVQIATSASSIIIGLVSVGVALPNPSYPKINGYAVVNGIMILVAGVYGLKATRPEEVLSCAVAPTARKYITIHYTLNITCLSISVLQIVFPAWAVSECFSQEPDLLAKCQPYTMFNTILGAIVIVIAIILFSTCIIGSMFICQYQRAFGFLDQHDRIQYELSLYAKKDDGKKAYGSNVVVVNAS